MNLPMDMPIPLSEQLKEVRREVALRQRVYPRWIANGKMSQATADRHLDLMRAVAETLAKLVEGEAR